MVKPPAPPTTPGARWRPLRAIGRAAKRWVAHDSMTASAALAFYTLLSLVPALAIGITIASAFLERDVVRTAVLDEIAERFGNDAATTVEPALRQAARLEPGPRARVLGTAWLLLAAGAVFVQLQSALDRVWDLPSAKRHVLLWFLRKRLVAFAMILAVGVLLLATTLATSLVPTVERALPVLLPLNTVLFPLAEILITATLFAITYRVLPDASPGWRALWVGSLPAAVLFFAGRWLIGVYLDRYALISAYGAAGSLLVILLWVYYSSMILLFGGELVRAFAESRPPRAPPGVRLKR